MYVSAAYKLYAGGETIEEATEARPFRLITGLGYTLDKFEEEILRFGEGENFCFTISRDDAYGERDEKNVRTFPRSAFADAQGKFDGQTIYEGNVIILNDGEGRQYYASVTRVTRDAVTVDLNHPLAGCDLTFEGRVLEMREATNEEISRLLTSMSGGCGGGCGGCSGGCGSGDGDCGGCGQ